MVRISELVVSRKGEDEEAPAAGGASSLKKLGMGRGRKICPTGIVIEGLELG